MRLDHIALRSFDRVACSKFFVDAFKYKIATEFVVDFPDGSKADAIVLEPPEKIIQGMPWIVQAPVSTKTTAWASEGSVLTREFPVMADYGLAPEIFISDGAEGSIVHNWCLANVKPGQVGAIHHMAYNVDDVRATMLEWQENGWAEFLGDVLTCPDDELDQIFTKPNKFTGIIYEFIKRGKHGFCKASVQKLMESSKGL